MWYSLDANIDVVRSRNISIGVFPAGFPPCGVPLFDNFDVDMRRFSGNSSGIVDQNKLLKKEWGTVVCLFHIALFFILFICIKHSNH